MDTLPHGSVDVVQVAYVVEQLERLRAPFAAVGLGLGIASQADPAARPAGPGEATAAVGMIPRRGREFLAGRLAARRALRAVGLECGDIPRAGRLPVFPPGRAASITHSAGVAVSVALAPGRTGAPGCDLELRELPPAAARLVLREDEEAWLHAAGPVLARDRLLALFSAKEAAWKALYGTPAHPVPGMGASGARVPGPPGTLRDLRAVPTPDGFVVRVRAGAESGGTDGRGVAGHGADVPGTDARGAGRGVEVRVRTVAGGVFSWVCL
ncbi:4'-phosphopantetheinyl transferase superfamily protein [Streptomyces sp. NPDC058274]|uniref:4'-phosphopantetheinyl transferase superfamily protein n=1 Tax=Streptomyces sp. NPDC058274 TaxID=3346416 RepID=UPI0036E328D2